MGRDPELREVEDNEHGRSWRVNSYLIFILGRPRKKGWRRAVLVSQIIDWSGTSLILCQ